MSPFLTAQPHLNPNVFSAICGEKTGVEFITAGGLPLKTGAGRSIPE